MHVCATLSPWAGCMCRMSCAMLFKLQLCGHSACQDREITANVRSHATCHFFQGGYSLSATCHWIGHPTLDIGHLSLYFSISSPYVMDGHALSA